MFGRRSKHNLEMENEYRNTILLRSKEKKETEVRTTTLANDIVARGKEKKVNKDKLPASIF